VKTIALLLERGADPDARDDNGLTPLDWLDRAAKSVDRDAVRRLLGQPRSL
jgi:ankyrin repeat protein